MIVVAAVFVLIMTLVQLAWEGGRGTEGEGAGGRAAKNSKQTVASQLGCRRVIEPLGFRVWGLRFRVAFERASEDLKPSCRMTFRKSRVSQT